MSKQLTVKKMDYLKGDITQWKADVGTQTQFENILEGDLFPEEKMKETPFQLDYIYVSIIFIIKHLLHNYSKIETYETYKNTLSDILVKKAYRIGEQGFENYKNSTSQESTKTVEYYALKYLYEQELYSRSIATISQSELSKQVFFLIDVQPQEEENVLMTLEPKYAWVTDAATSPTAAAAEEPPSTLSKTKKLLVTHDELIECRKLHMPQPQPKKAAEDQPEYVAIYSGVGKLKEVIGEILKKKNDNHTFTQPLPISGSLDLNTALRFMDPENPVLIVFYVPVNDNSIPLLSFLDSDINLTTVIKNSNPKDNSESYAQQQKKKPRLDIFPDKESEQEIFFAPFIEWIKIREDKSVSLKCTEKYIVDGRNEWRDVTKQNIAVLHLLYKSYDRDKAQETAVSMEMGKDYYQTLYDSVSPGHYKGTLPGESDLSWMNEYYEPLPANQGGGKKKRKTTTKNRKHKKKHKYTKYRTSKNKKKMSRRKRSNRKSKRKIFNV